MYFFEIRLDPVTNWHEGVRRLSLPCRDGTRCLRTGTVVDVTRGATIILFVMFAFPSLLK